MTKNLESNVGYGRPPLHSRFKAGESGNLSGRPKGAKNFAAELRAELHEPIRGQSGVTLTKMRAIINRLVTEAIAGDSKAVSLIVGHYLRGESDVDDGALDSPADREISANFGPRRPAKAGVDNGGQP